MNCLVSEASTASGSLVTVTSQPDQHSSADAPDLARLLLSAYSSECTTEYEVVCTTAQATSVSRSMAWRRFLSR
ncbi:hypothetical protein STENM327S_01309 [Streptomyces tendae]